MVPLAAARRMQPREIWMVEIEVARAGFEPATFHFSGERYYRLSYLAWSR